MFYTDRCFFPDSNLEKVDITSKEFKTLEKALKYIERYSKGWRFDSITLTDENNEQLLSIWDSGGKEEHNMELINQYKMKEGLK